MKLYLIQHGLALSKEEAPERPLSEKGKDETMKTAEALQVKGIKVGYIWHSRKARAAQTAEIISQTVECDKMMDRDDMNSNDPVEDVAKEIDRLEKDLMMVGHLPFLRKLASLLLTGTEEGEPVVFRNSGVVCLEREKGWKPAWQIAPE